MIYFPKIFKNYRMNLLSFKNNNLKVPLEKDKIEKEGNSEV